MSLLDFSQDTLVPDPFVSKPAGFFATPELTQRLNLIEHLIQNSEQLLLILAEAGSGKTMLLRQLEKMPHEHWWSYALSSSPALSPETLLSNVLAKFHVKQHGKPAPLLEESLRSHIAKTRLNGQLPILLVDDAHLLPLATLKLIVDLALKDHPGSQTRIRVVVFAEPQITSILATPEFEIVHNTLIHTLDIPAFSKLQVREYILFRLKGSRHSSVHPFNSEVLQQIYTQSEGVPSQVNTAAQQVLRQFNEQRPANVLLGSLSYSKLLWSVPIVLILLALGLVVYWTQPNAFNNAPADLVPSQTLPLPVPAVDEVTPLTTLPTETSNVADGDTLLNTDASSPLTAQEHANGHAPTVIAIAETLATPQETELPDPDSEVLGVALPLDAVDPEQLLGRADIYGEAWVLVQTPEFYTIQIMGTHELAGVKQFLGRYQLSGQPVALFKTDYRDKAWYVLVYGLYTDRQQAANALSQLPAPLQRRTQPWVRTIGSIQTLIRQRIEP